MKLATPLAALLCLTFTATVSHAQATEVTECGMDIKGDAYLSASLDCAGFDFGVNLYSKSRLDMGGFTISNAGLGVQCFANCEIVGPGSIDGNYMGLSAPHRAKITNVSFSGNTKPAIYAGTVTVSDSTISGNGSGIDFGRRLKLANSSVTANDVGLNGGFSPTSGECAAGRATLDNSSVNGNTTTDIVACQEPRLRHGSTCGKSQTYFGPDSWGVCSAD